jgi:TonB family protein
MKVSGTLGSLNQEEIEGPFQRRWDEITRCYQEARAGHAYLGGKVELKVRVASSGDPRQVFVSWSTFGHYAGERCLIEVARTLHFQRPHGGAEAEFVYPIEFRADRPPLAWDEARVSQSIAKHRSDVSACKAKSGKGLPSAVSMTVYVGPGGKVASAGLSADAPLDDEFAACLVERTHSWRLDDPLGRIAKATASVHD